MTVFRTATSGLALALAATVAAVSPALAADVSLKAQTALPRNHDLSKPFLQFFVPGVNKAGGTVKVNYIGGPEVTPANRAPAALQRGVIDILHSPSAYYTGTIPHGQGMLARTVTPDEARKNGAMDIFEKVWNQKLNAHLLAWGESAATFYLYFGKMPPMGPDGVPNLKGMKMRSTGAYRSILTGLGATLVSTPATDVYTALQRGVVDGFGWPNMGLKSLGLHEVTKYRLEPSFYNLANMVLVNLDKWKGLSKAQRDLLSSVGHTYEKASDAQITTLAAADKKAFLDAGGQIITLKGAAAKKYKAIAYEAMWQRMGKMMPAPEVAKLKPLLYKP